jgi:hypothetical protein
MAYVLAGLAVLLLIEGALRLTLARAQVRQRDYLERELGRALERLKVAAEVRGELNSRVAELEAELERRDGGPQLEGRYVIVNTPKPDDQSLRGWVRRQYATGALELADADLLERGPTGDLVAQPAGVVLIPANAWVGLDATPPAPEAR